ncbi:hypothetical protein [Methylobacterium sp. E-046]|uniref:hypothetical protein n=1 Tax=Methylobacterium sp. E-046 TaxID=2836576 RepID=UPI001FBC0A87|nr:hypothetical protein [Methylobacterium sp. E-046]MCJ2098547.1 hypothetical protein [Methylobacterium sp. E-046]
MAVLRHALILGLLLGAAPALAQSPAPNPGVGPSPSTATSPTASPSAPPAGGRRITATGQTKPPGTGAALPPRTVNEAEMIKAQKAAEARSKAWDSKMRNTMGSICHGC